MSGLLGNANRAAGLDSIDSAGAVLACEKTEDARAGADVEDNRIAADGRPQSPGIGARAALIRDHASVTRNAIHS